jgi:hypothetical protein
LKHQMARRANPFPKQKHSKLLWRGINLSPKQFTEKMLENRASICYRPGEMVTHSGQYSFARPRCDRKRIPVRVDVHHPAIFSPSTPREHPCSVAWRRSPRNGSNCNRSHCRSSAPALFLRASRVRRYPTAPAPPLGREGRPKIMPLPPLQNCRRLSPVFSARFRFNGHPSSP